MDLVLCEPIAESPNQFVTFGYSHVVLEVEIVNVLVINQERLRGSTCPVVVQLQRCFGVRERVVPAAQHIAAVEVAVVSKNSLIRWRQQRLPESFAVPSAIKVSLQRE